MGQTHADLIHLVGLIESKTGNATPASKNGKWTINKTYAELNALYIKGLKPGVQWHREDGSVISMPMTGVGKVSGKPAFTFSVILTDDDGSVYHAFILDSANVVTYVTEDVGGGGGDPGHYKKIQEPVEDPKAEGSSLSFISGITQNKEGVISPEKKNVPEASEKQAGVMSAKDKKKLDSIAEGAQVNVPADFSESDPEASSYIHARPLQRVKEKDAASDCVAVDDGTFNVITNDRYGTLTFQVVSKEHLTGKVAHAAIYLKAGIDCYVGAAVVSEPTERGGAELYMSTDDSLNIAYAGNRYLIEIVGDICRMNRVVLPATPALLAPNTFRFRFANPAFDPEAAGIAMTSQDISQKDDSGATYILHSVYGSWKKVQGALENLWDWALDPSFTDNMAGAFYNAFTGGNTVQLIEAGPLDSITTLECTFKGCTSLTSVCGLSVGAVTNMYATFENCSNLVGIGNFNTGNVTTFRACFGECARLKTGVDYIETSSATNMRYMFNNCKALPAVPSFDVTNVTNMVNAFNGCVGVKSGALALFNAASSKAIRVSSYNSAFRNCGKDTTTGAEELAQIPSSWK